jgi:hypothetical protein
MHIFRAVRAACTAAILVLVMGMIAGPLLYGIIVWDGLTGVRGKAHRRRIAWWQYFCGEAAFLTVRVAMGIRVRYELPKDLSEHGPFIIVANHLGGFDGFLVTHVLRKLGANVDLRAVGKREVAKYPFVGRAWRELKWGFVARDHRRDDYAVVERCARDADEDGANMLIFPEGTIFMVHNRKDPYRYVLPPKSGGLTKLHEILPGRKVLNLTIAWETRRHGLALMEGGVPYGRRVLLTTEVVELPADVREWLRAEWHRKDARIGADD